MEAVTSISLRDLHVQVSFFVDGLGENIERSRTVIDDAFADTNVSFLTVL